MKTKFEGLWKTRTAVYRSKPLTKKELQELPAKVRLIVRENKYHENNDDGTPRFVFTFADAGEAASIALEREKTEWQYKQWWEGFTEVWCYECPECGYETVDSECYTLPNFCPSCGAYMENGGIKR